MTPPSLCAPATWRPGVSINPPPSRPAGTLTGPGVWHAEGAGEAANPSREMGEAAAPPPMPSAPTYAAVLATDMAIEGLRPKAGPPGMAAGVGVELAERSSSAWLVSGWCQEGSTASCIMVPYL